MSLHSRPSPPDPLALDPLAPIGIGPGEVIYTTDPLALDPLSPVRIGARGVEAGTRNPESTSQRQD